MMVIDLLVAESVVFNLYNNKFTLLQEQLERPHHLSRELRWKAFYKGGHPTERQSR